MYKERKVASRAFSPSALDVATAPISNASIGPENAGLRHGEETPGSITALLAQHVGA